MRELLLWLTDAAWSSSDARAAMPLRLLARHRAGLCCLRVHQLAVLLQMLCETQPLTRRAQVVRRRAC